MAGKREAKRRDKTERVLRAAEEIFSTVPFDSVTTAQLAERAGLTTGTFFRYATSKAELFIHTYSTVLEQCLTRSRALPESASARQKILALVEPMIEATEKHPGNVSAFQREVLFGAGTGPQRERAVELVISLEREIKTILGGDRQLAHAVYATLYMAIVRVAVGTLAPESLRSNIEARVDFLLDAHAER
ncbi:TetR/AcrR family transcriptional regulator [Flaviflexus equikiangi]|uniref:TetR/AcrR family transcriptional regulator n=1 Tax=Flaviflexus equikiangi TaxID=2758573 RepID=A0ABS2TH63_9ACTO|nr:TetR/AcrR family transcriptional regulator [Flaviflexus equikiangi]MBM9434003.1 TetR/AcrR family transcriptional regulator [Flaviflexus equikiangi]